MFVKTPPRARMDVSETETFGGVPNEIVLLIIQWTTDIRALTALCTLNHHVRNLCMAQDIDWLAVHPVFAPIWERHKVCLTRPSLVDLVHVVGQQEALKGMQRRTLYALLCRVLPREKLPTLDRTDLGALERAVLREQVAYSSSSALCRHLARDLLKRISSRPYQMLTSDSLQSNESGRLSGLSCPIGVQVHSHVAPHGVLPGLSVDVKPSYGFDFAATAAVMDPRRETLSQDVACKASNVGWDATRRAFLFMDQARCAINAWLAHADLDDAIDSAQEKRAVCVDLFRAYPDARIYVLPADKNDKPSSGSAQLGVYLPSIGGDRLPKLRSLSAYNVSLY